MDSIGTRLKRAEHALTLIALASTPGEKPLDDVEILEAIHKASMEARVELYWINELPPEVVDLPAPDDDEVDKRYPFKGSPRVGRARGREKIIRETLAAAGGAR